jgi:hypothetical protein
LEEQRLPQEGQLAQWMDFIPDTHDISDRVSPTHGGQ